MVIVAIRALNLEYLSNGFKLKSESVHFYRLDST
jgi:hypothetical protein